MRFEFHYSYSYLYLPLHCELANLRSHCHYTLCSMRPHMDKIYEPLLIRWAFLKFILNAEFDIILSVHIVNMYCKQSL